MNMILIYMNVKTGDHYGADMSRGGSVMSNYPHSLPNKLHHQLWSAVGVPGDPDPGQMTKSVSTYQCLHVLQHFDDSIYEDVFMLKFEISSNQIFLTLPCFAPFVSIIYILFFCFRFLGYLKTKQHFWSKEISIEWEHMKIYCFLLFIAK